MKFLKLDKKKGSGGPSIKSRYAYLIHIDDIDYLPGTNEKGVRLEGDILLKEDCTMMPLYLTSSSQEFSYDILGDDDEKSYLVKFSGNHPGTELEALEFAKNMIEQPYLVLIPSCNENEPWKLLGELTNPLIFTSSHKGGSNNSKFTFNFEQRIGSEFIYFSYGGVEVPAGGEGVDPPSGGFDPTKWARIDASNIDAHIAAWRTKLGIDNPDHIITIGEATADSNKAYLALPPELINEVEIAQVRYSRNVAQEFPFTAVATYDKILIIEAKPDAQVFHLVEGVEAEEPEEPAYTGLFIARLKVSSTGTVVETEELGYKFKADDAWRQFTIGATPLIVSIGSSNASSFEFFTTEASPVFGGILTKLGKNTWDGKRYYLKNSSDKDIALTPTVIPEAGQAKAFTFDKSYVLKSNSDAIIRMKDGKLELIQLGGGGVYKANTISGSTSIYITGTVTLKIGNELVVTNPINVNSVFTLTLAAPILGQVNEYIFIFKTAGTVPVITFPAGLKWRGKNPVISINQTYVFVFEYVYFTSWEVYGVSIQNNT